MSPATEKPILDLVTKTSKLDYSMRQAHSGGSFPPPYAAVFALFDRCCSMLGAIRVLLAYDFVHEAVILTRPLFTDSLALTEIAASDDARRKELAVGLHMSGLAASVALFERVKASGGDVDEELATLADERKAIEGYARREGVSTKGWQPDDQAKDLAAKHGRTGEYLDLGVADHFIHGSTKATQQRYTVREDGSVEFGREAIDLETWANPTGLFAVHSALSAARAVCLIFDWTEPPELKALAAELAKARAAEARLL